MREPVGEMEEKNRL